MLKKFLVLTLFLGAFGFIQESQAQDECMIGEVRAFAGNFAPRNWALAQGQLLAVSQNEALFSIIGAIYGGDGRTTFGLPDLRGRVPIGAGSGTGLTTYQEGDKGGSESLNASQTHQHELRHASKIKDNADDNTDGETPKLLYADVAMGETDIKFQSSLQGTGSVEQPSNHQASTVLNYIICTLGVYPSRN